jgi:hypothetical protein
MRANAAPLPPPFPPPPTNTPPSHPLPPSYRSAGSLTRVHKSDISKSRLQGFVEAGPAERRALLEGAVEVNAV